MPGYDSESSDPPAPVVFVILRNPDTGAEIANVQMLIDTGADVTLIPSDTARQIGCEILTNHLVSGFDGTSGAYGEVFVEMLLLQKSFKGQFLTIDQPTGIIGRNILNFLVLTFDGPRLVWDEA